MGKQTSIVDTFITLVNELRAELQSCKAEIAELKVTIVLLQAENAQLREALSGKGQKANSQNSSLPPSQDPFRSKDLSLRSKSGKASGGQKGHVGNTLEFSTVPTQVQQHFPQGACTNCGLGIKNEGSDQIIKERRQVVDIPLITPVITEHQLMRVYCSCGHCNEGQFPAQVNARIQYGCRVQSLVGYLHTRQFMPFARMQEFLGGLLGIPLSQGSIQNLLVREAKRLTPAYNQIKQQVMNSPVVGSDETGAVVNGSNHWFWTWQTPVCTYIAAADSRGFKAVQKEFPEGFPNAILIHDCYGSQNKTQAKQHQQCIAHLQREIKKLQQIKQVPWLDNFKQLIKNAIQTKASLLPHQHHKRYEPVKKLFKRLHELIEDASKAPDDKNDLAAYTFYGRIRKHKEAILTFLTHFQVTPDNNASERAIRNIKVKQKVSGQFKSLENAHVFAIIRSVIDTNIKSNKPLFFASGF